MLTELQLRNFKSWRDTGPVRLAPLTGLFGTNSSGKTALIQALLVLKQTAESADRQRALVASGSHVDLGTFRDVLFRHADPGALEIAVAWDLPKLLSVRDPESAGNLFQIGGLRFRTRIAGSEAGIATEMFD